MKKIIILGGATYDSIVHLDHFPNPEAQTIHQCQFYDAVGSTGVGKAANLCHLGFDTTLQALIGKDSYGKAIQSFLKKLPIKFIPTFDPAGTERHVNLMDANGQRISIFLTNSSSNPAINYKKLTSPILKADAVVLNIIDHCRHFIPYIASKKGAIWTDLHDYDGKSSYHDDFISIADYIFLSSDNLSNYEATMEKLMKKDKKLVVCTHGKKGATLLSADGTWIESPVINSFYAVDTNGAGDAFFSGFMYGFLNNYTLNESLNIGHIAGGLCVSCNKIAYPGLSEDLLLSYLNKKSII